jgi:hypothetical protein
MLPVGNTTAEYLVIGKDGNRSTAGPVTLVVAPLPIEPPTVPPTQPPQNITDTQQPFTIPPATGVNSTDPYNTTVTIAKNGTNGTLEPLIPGLKPGDNLTAQQLEELGKDPNNLPLVIVYNVTNTNGSDTSTASLEITFPPLSPALPDLPPSVSVLASNATGKDATGYVPDELANYIGMAALMDPFNFVGKYGTVAHVYPIPSGQQCHERPAHDLGQVQRLGHVGARH